MVDTLYKQQIAAILRIMNIEHIYYVDDRLTEHGTIEVQDLIGALGSETTSVQRDAIELLIPGTILSGPESVIRSSVQRSIESVDDDGERSRITSEIGTILDIKPSTQPNLQAQFLTEIFRDEFDVHCITPIKWEEIESTVIDAAQPNSRVLCLFDQVFDKDRTSIGFTSGINIIRRLTQLTKGRQVLFCLLFTSETDISNEIEYWRNQVIEHDIASSKFFPLSKKRVVTSQSFAEGIQIGSINSLYDQLKAGTFTMLNRASGDAENGLDEIELLNLNHMILSSSKSEGVWEATTLLRLYDIIRNERIKARMVSEKYITFFNDNINKVDQINDILQTVPVVVASQRFKLRHQELYESASNLNNTFSDVKTGDIFRALTDLGGEQDFVVLAQPCDLLVRTKDGERKAAVVTLAPIRLKSQKDYKRYKSSKVDYIKMTFPLEYYTEGSDNVGFVEFNNIFSIQISILDLAAINEEGKCSIDVANTALCPPELHIAWQKRHASLISEFRTVYEKMKGIQDFCSKPTVSKAIKKLLVSLAPVPYISVLQKSELLIPDFDFLNTSIEYGRDRKPEDIIIPKFTFSGTTIDYGLRRVSSVRPPISTYLLDAYTKYLSRVAYEHDFSEWK